MARAGLLDVHRDERRPAAARASAPSRRATATSRDGRARAAARSSPAPPRPRPRRDRRRRRRPEEAVVSIDARAHHAVRGAGHRAAPRQRRHRPDHPGAVPEDHDAAPGSARTCSPTGGSTPPGRRRPDFILNAPAARGRGGAGGGLELRVRQLARARAVGARRLRLPRGRRRVVRRHLQAERAEERPAADRAAGRRSTRRCWPRVAAQPGPRHRRGPRRAGRHAAGRPARRSRSTRSRASACWPAWTRSATCSGRQEAIAAFEARRGGASLDRTGRHGRPE